MKRHLTPIVLLALFACDYDPRADRFIEAAHQCSDLYAPQQLDATAAGDDCLVLLIRAKTRLSATEVEAIHYGTGDRAAYPGGVQQFLENRGFRAAVYRDPEERQWTFGGIADDELRSLEPCR